VLDVDREYRERATAGDLPRVAPRHFNPQGNAWLPVLHTHRGRHRYTALFSNSERAHHLGRTRDWVIVICASGADTRQYTVITAERGRLRGRRIIPGRERQCAAHYLRCRSMGAGASPGEPRGSVGCSDPRHELATKDAGP
jgi:hypothetical protein